MGDASPLDDNEMRRLLAAVLAPHATGLVLAVSGGPDSMAMLHCAARLRQRDHLPPLTVGTVDHRLRAGSQADCALVEDAAQARGLPVRRLVWTGDKPIRAVQEKARDARYALLAGLCAEVGADHLVTAHTLDDQAETVLLRLLRGSGVAGLAAMRTVAMRGSVRHVRPLLGIPKDRLIATCTTAGVPFCEDPSNADPRFARARLRTMLPLLAGERCDAPTLARLARRAARADEALAHAAEAAFRAVALRPEDGGVRLDGCRLTAMPLELCIRVLGMAIAEGGGAARHLDGLERLADTVRRSAAMGAAARVTFGGTVVALSSEGLLTVSREGPRRRGSRAPAREWRQRPVASPASPPPMTFPWQG